MSIETEVEFVLTTNKARKTFTITFCRGATHPAMKAVQALYDSYERPASGVEMVKFLRAAVEPHTEVVADQPWSPCHMPFCKGKVPPKVQV